MKAEKHHISVCICTYKRPHMLARLLSELETQETEGLFDYSIVVVDNDSAESARETAESCARRSKISISYCVEPEQNIALARNKALESAKGDFIGFMDDDESPQQSWLASLYKTCKRYNADGALGPVLPYFDGTPPKWILRGKFYERPSHETGAILQWRFTRTGNVLFRAGILQGNKRMFNPKLGSGGEDRDFFRRMIERGHKFVWCNEAPVHEIIPPHRWKKSFMLRRALLRGQNPTHSKWSVVTSLIAIPIYTVSLPFLLFIGKHTFMKYLIKDCDHLGKVLAFLGLGVIKEKYITE